MTTRFTEPVINSTEELLFGNAPNPVRLTAEIEAGAGYTLPELNYTLPHGAEVAADTMDKVVQAYRDMADSALKRALELGIERLVIEIELVFEMTLHPEWGERVIRATKETIDSYAEQGIHAALRTTVADIRDRSRPPRNRTGAEVPNVLETFERCAPYSDILSIESTGGKELSDEALLMCDMGGVIYALGGLASNDMEFLWQKVVGISREYGKVPGGDAACGFANTAMQLARQKMIPKVFAAVVRAVGAARSLVAIECGATGPDKDCAYEGPILKAITGIPIAMEGKSAACAHSSHIGNVAMCACDLWSNESVPYAQLFGGYTPAVSLEELWYDCKLMNRAINDGNALMLRNMLSDSDTFSSAEALVLSPDSCLRIARAITSSTDTVQRAWNAANEALNIIEEATQAGQLTLDAREQPFLPSIRRSLDDFQMIDDKVGYYSSLYPDRFLPEEYGL